MMRLSTTKAKIEPPTNAYLKSEMRCGLIPTKYVETSDKHNFIKAFLWNISFQSSYFPYNPFIKVNEIKELPSYSNA